MSESILDWSAVTANRMFISDTGGAVEATQGGVPVRLGRYAAWAPLPGDGGRHRVVEVSSDLPSLMKKYNIPREMVLSLETHRDKR